jgi:hypothetical protein
MADSAYLRERPGLTRTGSGLLCAAAAGGLLGGLAMFFVMAGYNASAGMGFLTIVNVCFAAGVFRGASMASATPTGHAGAPAMAGETAMPGHTPMASPMPSHTAMASAMPSHTAMASHGAAGAGAMGGHGMGAGAMMNQPLLASHIIVGGLLHLAMSAAAAVMFALVLAVLIRAGLRVLATPAGYVAAAVPGGALLYVVMLYGFAPLWNTEIVDLTPRVPFFLSHLLFGAAVGGWVYWQAGEARTGIRIRAHQPPLGGTA